MKVSRRHILKLAAAALASKAFSQSAFGQSSAPPAAGAAAQSPIGLGVSDDTITIGMSADFSSPFAAQGIEAYRGTLAVFEEVNEQGGIFDRRVQLIALNDGGDSSAAIDNTLRLLEVDQVFCLSNYTDDTAIARSLPIVHSYRDSRLRMVGNLSGALIQRRLPYVEQVYNVRASTLQETSQLTDAMWQVGRRQPGVFYTADASGRVGQAGVVRALEAYGATVAAEATHNPLLNQQLRGDAGRTGRADLRQDEREALQEALRDEVDSAVRHLRAGDCDSIICTTDTETLGYLVAAVRDSGWNVPILVTNVDDDTPGQLIALENSNDAPAGSYTQNLVAARVLPFYRERSFPGVNLYHQLLDKWNPDIPPGTRSNYTPGRNSAGLEGTLNARVLIAGLRLAGADITRARFDESLAGLSELDLGIDAPVSYVGGNRQGLNRIYYTAVAGSSWNMIPDAVSGLNL